MATANPRHVWISVSALVLVSLGLSTLGITWGLPAVGSWAPDTIAGTRTLRTMGTWPDRWPTYYPPFHFFVNQTAYHSLMDSWEDKGKMIWAQPPATPGGKPIPCERHAPGSVPLFLEPIEQIGALLLVSRGISAAMSVATVLLLVACGVRLFEDWWVGILAGLTVSTCAEWVFFSNLGNLDVPQMMWFVLTLYLFIRVCQTDRWHHYLLLGLFTSVAMSTKDAVAGTYVGMVIVIGAVRVHRLITSGSSLRQASGALFHGHMWIGFLSFAIPYATIQGLWAAPQVYKGRLNHYLFGPGTSDVNQSYEGPLWLAREALLESARALGWPMLTIMFIAVIYGLIRFRSRTLLLLTPCVTYYFIVCSTTGVAFARVLFPVFICCAILTGRALASWLYWGPMPTAVRYATTATLFLLTFGYAAAVGFEKSDDTRYRAERWIAETTEGNATIGVFSHPQYLPRFFAAHRRAQLLDMNEEQMHRSAAPYLLLSRHNFEDFTTDQRECLKALRDGKLGYSPEPMIRFTSRFLPPQRHWMALAGWGTRGAGKVSPELIVLKRTAP